MEIHLCHGARPHGWQVTGDKSLAVMSTFWTSAAADLKNCQSMSVCKCQLSVKNCQLSTVTCQLSTVSGDVTPTQGSNHDDRNDRSVDVWNPGIERNAELIAKQCASQWASLAFSSPCLLPSSPHPSLKLSQFPITSHTKQLYIHRKSFRCDQHSTSGSWKQLHWQVTGRLVTDDRWKSERHSDDTSLLEKTEVQAGPGQRCLYLAKFQTKSHDKLTTAKDWIWLAIVFCQLSNVSTVELSVSTVEHQHLQIHGTTCPEWSPGTWSHLGTK